MYHLLQIFKLSRLVTNRLAEDETSQTLLVQIRRFMQKQETGAKIVIFIENWGKICGWGWVGFSDTYF